MADKIRVLIVDDEALARERVRSLLDERADIHVVAEAGDGLTAVRAIQEHDPDLVFLDVQMPEMDGFEVLSALEGPSLPEVIFVTAFDRYALKAFDVHALDYLLKPFDRERFSQAVDRALLRMGNARPGEVATEMAQVLHELRSRLGSQRVERFVVRDRDRIRFVMIEDIEWIEAAGNYVTLHLDGVSHMLRGTMKAVESTLDPLRFVRVHRSGIVNLDRVREIQPWFNGDFMILTKSGHKVTTGETYRARVQELLKNPL